MSQILFFDIDGTMLSTGGAGQRAMELALTEEFRVEFPFEGVLVAGRTDRGIADEIFATHCLEDSPAQRERFMRAYLERLPTCLRTLPGALLPGVRELLELLGEAGTIELGLLTGNYVDGAWIKLRHFGIDHFFSFGGFGDIHPERDDVARTALSNASQTLQRQLSGQESAVIGDTPADIRCARAINARAIAVATGIYQRHILADHTPDHLFDDFRDVRAVADTLLDRAF
ncbi:MAG: haloacid dehalogenase-like hydrolase [Planctomycetaceae bacterium]|nr:haloacid dehalogenase-like hydrolase [Planctomycetaceae bacterium]